MNEKRFDLIDGCICDDKIPMTCGNVIDTLNDSWEELLFWKQVASQRANEIEKLNNIHKENENLKQALWEAEVNYYGERCDNPLDYESWIEDLKEEWDKEYWND